MLNAQDLSLGYERRATVPLETAQQLIKSGKRVNIFSDRKEELEEVRKALEQNFPVSTVLEANSRYGESWFIRVNWMDRGFSAREFLTSLVGS